jgi:hypothetical protein
MLQKFAKKIGLGVLGTSLALLLPLTAAARDRDDRGFDRDREHARLEQLRKRQHVAAERFDRERSYAQGYRRGYANGYYDSFGHLRPYGARY